MNKKWLFVGIPALLIVLAISFFSFLISSLHSSFTVPNLVDLSNLKSTRKIVLEPKLGEQTSFSLSTHTIPFPLNSVPIVDVGGKQILNIQELAFSPDGSRAAFLTYALKDAKVSNYLVVDNEILPLPNTWDVYMNVNKLTFSEDSKKLFFLVSVMDSKYSTDWSKILVVKDRNSDSYYTILPMADNKDNYMLDNHIYSLSDLSHPTLYQDSVSSGKETATVTSGGGGEFSAPYSYVTLTTEGKTIFTSKSYITSIHDVTITPDGNAVAYGFGGAVYGNESYGGYGSNNNYGRSFIAIDDKPGQIVDAIAGGTPRFSPDGKYIAYGALDKNKLWWIVEEVVQDPVDQTVELLSDIK